MIFKSVVCAAVFCVMGCSSTTNADSVEDLVQKMTLEEKIQLVGGTGFATAPIARLNIPALEMSDGPLGLRFVDDATQWPAGVAMGATFNPSLIYEMSMALGEEARAASKRLLLGPTINNARTPWGGRNFESFGEDPTLIGQMTKSYITGVQSQGVGTAVKHFAAYNQEWGRTFNDVIVSERALREIYLPAFQVAVDSGTASVMSAYNKINGLYASENEHLLNQILKGEWGFKGFVVSDWDGTHSTIPAALGGLDLEMPIGIFFGDRLLQAVRSGKVAVTVIDDKVRRILHSMEKIGLFEAFQMPAGQFKKNHPDVALKVAQESLVLLKNENHILPLPNNLPANKPLKIAMLGSSVKTIRQGGGSSMVHFGNPVSPFQGLTDLVAKKSWSVQILTGEPLLLPGDALPHPPIFWDAETKQSGFHGEYFNNPDIIGTPAAIRSDAAVDFDWEWGGPGIGGISPNDFSVRWTAELKPRLTGDHEFILMHDDGIRVSVNGKMILDRWTRDPMKPSLVEDRLVLNLKANEISHFQIDYRQEDQLSYMQMGVREPGQTVSPVELAKKADYALLFVGNSFKIESEGYDRQTFRLTDEQEKLINDVVAVQPKTIVIVQAGSPIEMKTWLKQVPGVIFAWYPGEQGGPAIANLLMGESNASGHLPITLPDSWKDSSAATEYPGANGKTFYKDDIFVGYRHFDKNRITPMFPFGYGLSYSNMVAKIEKVQVIDASVKNPTVKVTITAENKGPLAGAQLLPIYVTDLKPQLEKAPKELKGFEKVQLNVGEKKTVVITLDAKAFQYFDEKNKSWRIDPGNYRLGLYSNESTLVDSRDIQLR